MTISQRRDRLRERLVAADLDAMLVSDLVNVRYLSGFTGSNAALLIRAEDRHRCWPPTGGTARRPHSRPPTPRSSSSGHADRTWSRARPPTACRRLGFESHVVTVDGHSMPHQGGR